MFGLHHLRQLDFHKRLGFHLLFSLKTLPKVRAPADFTRDHGLDSQTLHGRLGRVPAGPARLASTIMGGNRARVRVLLQIMERVNTTHGPKEYRWDYADPPPVVGKKPRRGVRPYRCSVCGDTDDFDTLCWCGLFCGRCAWFHPPTTHSATMHSTILLSIAEVGALLNRAAPAPTQQPWQRQRRKPTRFGASPPSVPEIGPAKEVDREAKKARKEARIRARKARKLRARARKGNSSDSE